MTLQKKPKTVIKKDSFQYKHFKKNKSHHYLKPYFPYLPLFILIMIGSIAIIFANNIGSNNNFTVSKLLSLANSIRSSNHKSQLAINNNLSQIAQLNANLINSNNNKNETLISNNSNNSIGENVAYNFSSPNQTIQAWLSDQNLNQLVLNNNFNSVGFGIVKNHTSNSKFIVVAVYANSSTNNLSEITFNVPFNKTNNNIKLISGKERLVSRLSLIDSNPIYQTSLIVILVFLVFLFIVRHLVFLKKSIINGEKILLNHIWLDILVVLIIFLGIYMTQIIGRIY